MANELVEGSDFNALEAKVNKNETDNDNLETKVNNSYTTTKTSISNLKTKVGNIELFNLKSNYDTKVGNLELKILDVSGLLQTRSFNSQ